MKRINENTKTTLTFGQLKRLVRESQTMSIKDYAEMEGLDEDEFFDVVARNYPECEFDDELSLDQLAMCAQECGETRRGYIRESGDGAALEALGKAIRKIIGYWPDGLTMTNDTFAFGSLSFKVDVSKESPWRAISVDKPITIQGPLADQFPGAIAGLFLTADKASLQRIVDIFNGLY